MGIRSEFTLANINDEQIIEVASRLQPFLPNFCSPIDISMVKMNAGACSGYPIALGVVAFLSRETGFATIPDIIQRNLKIDAAVDLTPEIEEAWGDLLKLHCLALSGIASEIVGESYAVIYNDSLCSTGIIKFENGSATKGSVFGSGGTDVLFKFDGPIASVNIVDTDSDFNYVETIQSEFVRFFSDESILECLLTDQLEELGRCQMMDARELVSPLQIVT